MKIHPTLGPRIDMPDNDDIMIVDFETARLEDDGILHPDLGRALRAMIRDSIRDNDAGAKSHIIQILDMIEQ